MHLGEIFALLHLRVRAAPFIALSSPGIIKAVENETQELVVAESSIISWDPKVSISQHK